ncbi:MAG TPA: proline racemase family protein [Vicinamibacterales bacterium]|nr:proline racemase family protein [Vicinamibacterales bacterium]
MAANYRTLDAHVGGEPVRLIVDGFPTPRGKSMLDKRDWARQHADGIRRTLMLEPRGHADMTGAVMTEAAAPGSHAGLLFMNSGGFGTLSGAGVIAAATIALERNLLMPGGDGQTIVFDTPSGAVRARASMKDGRVKRVEYANVPSFVFAAGFPIKIGPRVIRVDIAYAGAFYAIVDSETAGLGVNTQMASELRRAGIDIKEAIDAAQVMAHPLEPRLEGLEGTIFTAPPSAEGADLRSVTVSASGAIDRSPGGTSTAAIMTVLHAMGFLSADAPFVHESVIGSTFRAWITGHSRVGEYDAIVPTLEATAWITGEHRFTLQPDDPIADGFLL